MSNNRLLIDHTGYSLKPKSSSKSEGNKLQAPRVIPVHPPHTAPTVKVSSGVDSVRKSNAAKAGFHHRCPHEVSSLPNAANQRSLASTSNYLTQPAKDLIGRRKLPLKPDEVFETMSKHYIPSPSNASRPFSKTSFSKGSEERPSSIPHVVSGRSMASASNPNTPTTLRIPNLSAVTARKLTSKSDLALTSQQKATYKGLEYLRVAGFDSAETNEYKNERIIQWLKTLPPGCEFANLHKRECQVNDVKDLGPLRSSGRTVSRPSSKQSIPVSVVVPQTRPRETRRPAKSTEAGEATPTQSLNWLKCPSPTRAQRKSPNREALECFQKHIDPTASFLLKCSGGSSESKLRNELDVRADALHKKMCAKRGK